MVQVVIDNRSAFVKVRKLLMKKNNLYWTSNVANYINLNGNNFLWWSQAVHMYIKGRSKIGYLTGDTKELTKTDVVYAT